jgi:hypothetical protein
LNSDPLEEKTMRALACVTAILLQAFVVSAAFAAPQDTKPAQIAAEAFVKAIVARDFEAFKAMCASKLQAEHAKNPKNCMITSWWDATQEELTKHNAKWVYKGVKSNFPKDVTLAYTRTMDSGELVVHIGVIQEGDKWLIDSAGSL